jgi:hypothetical protein
VTIHKESNELAWRTVLLKEDMRDPELNGAAFVVEDWWDKIGGVSWMFSDGNPAALKYAFRSGFKGLPIDDEVVYGKVGGLGHIIHVSEIED